MGEFYSRSELTGSQNIQAGEAGFEAAEGVEQQAEGGEHDVNDPVRLGVARAGQRPGTDRARQAEEGSMSRYHLALSPAPANHAPDE